jgi:ABC-2 type transport system ATP-binding protein
MSIIEVNDLTKFYGKARGIENVSFNVEDGEIFGFIGPNGAGKSTTIRLFLSLIYPTSGEVKIFGKDCIKDGPEIRQEIGYLPSEVFYYDRMRVNDLLKYSASFYKKDCTERTRELAERKSELCRDCYTNPGLYCWMSLPVVSTRSCSKNSLL